MSDNITNAMFSDLDSLAEIETEEPSETPSSRTPAIPLEGEYSGYPTRKRERPIHRLMAYMSCKGATPKEIADKTGYHIVTVREIMSQTWFRNFVAEEMATSNRDDIKSLIEGGALDAVMTLRRLVTTANSEAVQRAAADSLLDRHLGKATQYIESKHHSLPDDPVEAAKAIDAEIAQLRGQESGVSSAR